LPARLQSGNLRLLVSDAGTLDRTLDQPRMQSHPPNLETTLALARRQHPADRLYVSLLMPETQAGMEGQTLTGLPLSMANALEPLRTAQETTLNGESAEVAGEAPAGGDCYPPAPNLHLTVRIRTDHEPNSRTCSTCGGRRIIAVQVRPG